MAVQRGTATLIVCRRERVSFCASKMFKDGRKWWVGRVAANSGVVAVLAGARLKRAERVSVPRASEGQNNDTTEANEIGLAILDISPLSCPAVDST